MELWHCWPCSFLHWLRAPTILMAFSVLSLRLDSAKTRPTKSAPAPALASAVASSITPQIYGIMWVCIRKPNF